MKHEYEDRMGQIDNLFETVYRNYKMFEADICMFGKKEFVYSMNNRFKYIIRIKDDRFRYWIRIVMFEINFNWFNLCYKNIEMFGGDIFEFSSELFFIVDAYKLLSLIWNSNREHIMLCPLIREIIYELLNVLCYSLRKLQKFNSHSDR